MCVHVGVVRVVRGVVVLASMGRRIAAVTLIPPSDTTRPHLLLPIIFACGGGRQQSVKLLILGLKTCGGCYKKTSRVTLPALRNGLISVTFSKCLREPYR